MVAGFSYKFIGFLVLMAVLVGGQSSATTKPSSYFTVDANAEATSTQNPWGDNVYNGNEETTASNGITSSGVSPAVGAGQGVTGANVQAAGVGGVESATVSGAPDTSSPTLAADDGNSTQSFSNSPAALNAGAFLIVAYVTLY